jgi:glycosyltransferase involved in cell wall biosynthesis
MTLYIKLRVYFRKFIYRLKSAKTLQDYVQLIVITVKFTSYSLKKIISRLRYRKKIQPDFSTLYRRSIDYSPLVSVIVPNYNHGRYLKERLDSIYSQDYLNFEVILLDDNSDDKSLEILESYLANYSHNTRLIINDVNSGSGYRQWTKGIALAEGDLIWIAESDDISECTFLSSLVPRFQNEAVRIAFSNTVFFEESQDNIIWDLSSYWHGRTLLSPNDDWVLFDSEFVNAGMCDSNLIPNVSSVLFTKPSDFKLNASWRDFKFCGDWLFYVYQMAGGLIAFNPETTNYYRVHADSTIRKNLNSELFFQEIESARSEIAHLMERPRVLFALPGLVIGGGELFPFRMAQVSEKYGVVSSVIDLGILPPTDKDFFLNSKTVPLFQPMIASDFVSNSGRNWDLVYSHHASADEICAQYRPADLQHLISLHGMYEEIDTLNVARLEKIFFEKPPTFTYTIEKNLSGFSKEFRESNDFFKVINFIPEQIIPKNLLSFSFESDEINICLIARAIPGKGWVEAVKATKMAREISGKNIKLNLFGSGPLNAQVRKNFNYEWLEIADSTNNSLLTASQMHAGLFLSTYAGESMPLILMEFLAIGLPTIFTTNGLSTEIMTDHLGELGIRIGKKDTNFDCESLASAIIDLTSMPDLERRKLRLRMLNKFTQYSGSRNMPKYVGIFKEVIQGDGKPE